MPANHWSSSTRDSRSMSTSRPAIAYPTGATMLTSASDAATLPKLEDIYLPAARNMQCLAQGQVVDVTY